MFSIIRKMLARARSFDAVFDRLDKIEAQLDKYEKLADENESLWQYLDEQKEMNGIWTGSAEDFEDEISDMMVRNMKSQGDA
jgi:flagellar motility protein MotE (MotC chaperone)